MERIHASGGLGRAALAAVLTLIVLVVSTCSGDTDAEPRAVAWSWDPCGLAPPAEVSAAFGEPAVAVASPNAGECRYEVGNVLLRIVVLADDDRCEGAQRALTALGSTVSTSPDAAPGVFTIEPQGDVLVCDPQATYVMRADGSAAELVELAQIAPSERSN